MEFTSRYVPTSPWAGFLASLWPHLPCQTLPLSGLHHGGTLPPRGLTWTLPAGHKGLYHSHLHLSHALHNQANSRRWTKEGSDYIKIVPLPQSEKAGVGWRGGLEPLHTGSRRGVLGGTACYMTRPHDLEKLHPIQGDCALPSHSLVPWGRFRTKARDGLMGVLPTEKDVRAQKKPGTATLVSWTCLSPLVWHRRCPATLIDLY